MTRTNVLTPRAAIVRGAAQRARHSGAPLPSAPVAPRLAPEAEADAMWCVAYARPDAAWSRARAAHAARTLSTLARHEATLAKWFARAGFMDESAIRWREAMFLFSESNRVARLLGPEPPPTV